MFFFWGGGVPPFVGGSWKEAQLTRPLVSQQPNNRKFSCRVGGSMVHCTEYMANDDSSGPPRRADPEKCQCQFC